MYTHYFVGTISLFLSVVIPLMFIFIRQTVKFHRQEVIKDLSDFFTTPGRPGASPMIPSFEFVKFKYFLPHGLGRVRSDFPVWAWATAILPFSVATGVIGWMSLTMIAGSTQFVLPFLWEKSGNITLWAVAASSAFFGAYLSTIRTFSRAIHNFDLSPALIASTAVDILASVGLAAILVVGLVEIVEGSTSTKSIQAIVVLFSFAIGFFPEAATRNILARSRLRNFKRENGDIFKYVEATPIELIDGIDTGIRSRLADFHIDSTQNLATANPLMLFVETPFGVYQIMDWVAQAQLCASVGPNAMAAMWNIGVRTLFDLERVALDPRSRNRGLLLAIGPILFKDVSTPPGSDAAQLFNEEAVRANIQMRLDDPHVHRLRQIYMQVGERIGERYWRLRGGGYDWPQTIVSDGVCFKAPNVLQFTRDKPVLYAQDKLLIIGGRNNGKIVTVTSIGETAVTVDGSSIEDSDPKTEHKLLRLNP